MFGFKSERSKKVARDKAYWHDIAARHYANLEAERGVPARSLRSPQPSRPKKAGFGRRPIKASPI